MPGAVQNVRSSRDANVAFRLTTRFLTGHCHDNARSSRGASPSSSPDDDGRAGDQSARAFQNTTLWSPGP